MNYPENPIFILSEVLEDYEFELSRFEYQKCLYKLSLVYAYDEVCRRMVGVRSFGYI